MLKSIDFWPLVPKKLSVESSINDDVHQKSMFKVHTLAIFYPRILTRKCHLIFDLMVFLH